jgi:hypothetical protein
MTDLLEWAERARYSDPITSKEAAHEARAFAGKQQGQIIEALRKACRPLAPEEIANALGWASHVPANRRTSELEKLGQIEVAPGDFHINASGRRARRYRLKVQP